MTVVKIVVIILLIILNIVLLPSKGTGDVAVWTSYIYGMRQNGAWQYFQACISHHCIVNSQDYPPGYYYILYLFEQVKYLNHISPLMTIKIVIFIFSIVSCVSLLIYEKLLHRNTILLSSFDTVMLYLVNVSLLLNTQGLGYIDVFVIPPYIFFLYFVTRSKYLIGGLCFGLCLLIKWQPILSFPLVCLYAYKDKQWRGLLPLITGAGIVLLLVFLIDINSLFVYLHSFKLAVQGDVVAVAAPNLVWLLLRAFRVIGLGSLVGFGHGMYAIVDQFSSLTQFGIISLFKFIFVIYYSCILYQYSKRYSKLTSNIFTLFNNLVAVMVGYFMLSSNVHENHLMLGVIIAMMLYIAKPSRRNLFLLLQLDFVSAISMFIFYGISGNSLVAYTYWGIMPGTIVAIGFTVWFFIFLRSNKDKFIL